MMTKLRFSFIILLFILCIGCLNSKTLVNDADLGIRITISEKNTNRDSVPSIYMSSSEMLKINDTVVIKTAAYNYSSDIKIDNTDEVISQNDSKIDTVFRYLVYTDDEKSGRSFESGSKNVSKFKVDSILTRLGYNNFKILDWKLTNTKIIGNKKIDYYQPINKITVETPDTVKLTYDKELRHISYFTYSRKLDSLANSKLSEIQLIINDTPNAKGIDLTLKIEKIRIPKDMNLRKILDEYQGRSVFVTKDDK